MGSTVAPFRRTRTAVIAAATLFLAAAAHVFGGGSLPRPDVLLILAGLVTLPVAALTARKVSTPTMMATLGIGQVLLHEAFVQLSPAHSMGMAMHDHGMATGSPPAMFESAMLSSLVMLGAHCLATVGTAVVLAKNEAALFALMAWLRPLLRLPEVHVPPAAPSVPPSPAGRIVPVLWRQLKIHPLRGPPLVRIIQL
ncbi:hypothetical protein [Arthrobacter sp. H14]|uniref:hypothetical protein n=1 Tax=Arthrobacter sp. H14 TaxID=1312959 RepID=UPI00047E488C|nr:hypothetical protein [Arthrobacter sp. H14]